MSVEATSWALQQQAVTDPGARSVLFGLANHANHEGRHAFPSVDLLRRYTGLGRRTVITKLKLLQEKGLVRRGNQKVAAAIIERADRRPTVYDLALGTGLEPIDLGDEQTPDQPQQQGAGNAPRDNERDASDAPRYHNGVQMTTERGARVAPEPSGTVPYSHSDASAPDADQSDSDGIFDRARQFDDNGDRLTAGSRQFRMTLDWQPEQALWQAECQRRGLPADTEYSASELADFTAHHADTGRRYGNHAWTSKFVRWVQENRKREAARQKPANNQTSGGSHAPRSQRPRQYQSAAEARRAAESGGQRVGDTFDGDWAPGRG
ncbi:helix-turn-helix protein [Kushneria sinocarnis]|uniref:Helix-turn-helix protein n=1 Tax=Kushneria sinocarnis TaxID=595502 RepID=A0A420WVP9_9GAMM|nr:DnaT-like ssDNA-binding domain-containing protein [Kushneria sinocarnis]RKR02615.1 helix-turn-helix protein [Kushneria sinocarnis]